MWRTVAARLSALGRGAKRTDRTGAQAEPASQVLGFHFARTGGTTLLNHLERQLGPEACFNYGTNPDIARLLNGERLFEDRPAEERAGYRLIFGHQVDDHLLAIAGAPSVDLFTVTRDPYDRLLSIFKHDTRLRRQRGLPVRGLQAVMTDLGPDPFARALVRRFPRLAGEGDLRAQALRVLRHFRFVLATEDLDRQAPYLCAALGCPGEMARRRQYAEAVADPELSRADVHAASPVDAEINQRVRAHTPPDPGAFNPFGYTPAVARAGIARVQAETTLAAARAHHLARMERALQHTNTLPAVQQVLATARADHPTAARLRAIAWRPPTSADEAEGVFQRAAVRRGQGDHAGALGDLETAVRLNPDNANARAARAVYRLDAARLQDALADARAAVAASPHDAGNWWTLADVQATLGEQAAAAESIQRALEIAPENDAIRRRYEELVATG